MTSSMIITCFTDSGSTWLSSNCTHRYSLLKLTTTGGWMFLSWLILVISQVSSSTRVCTEKQVQCYPLALWPENDNKSWNESWNPESLKNIYLDSNWSDVDGQGQSSRSWWPDVSSLLKLLMSQKHLEGVSVHMEQTSSSHAPTY